MTYARSGKKILLVDADIFKPRLSKLLNAPSSSGLFDYFIQKTQSELSYPANSRGKPFSSSLRSNTAKSCGVDFVKKNGALLKLLANKFDLLLIDSPPISASNGIAMLASYVDGVVVVRPIAPIIMLLPKHQET